MAGRWAKVPESVLQDEGLTQRDLRVYIALALHADKQGRCWPKRHQLTALTGIHKRNITLATQRLVTRGHLAKVGHGGRSRPAQYLLTEPEKGVTTDTVSDPKRVSDGNTLLPPQKGVAADTVYGQKGVTTDTRTEQTTQNGTAFPAGESVSPAQENVSLVEVVEVYNRVLPELPTAKIPTAEMTHDFADLLEKHNAAAAAAFWEDEYFPMVRRCPFLLGKGRTRFLATLGWLLKYDNAAKVLNGEYLDGDQQHAWGDHTMTDFDAADAYEAADRKRRFVC